jgi:hypothetical protein
MDPAEVFMATFKQYLAWGLAIYTLLAILSIVGAVARSRLETRRHEAVIAELSRVGLKIEIEGIRLRDFLAAKASRRLRGRAMEARLRLHHGDQARDRILVGRILDGKDAVDEDDAEIEAEMKKIAGGARKG